MAKRSLPSVTADFKSVLEFLQGRGIVPGSPAVDLVDGARRIHRATYSLILWRFRLTRLPENGRVFVEEIASDALQILPQVLMGYSKTTKLLTRGVIENTLRHIYFSDHPIEFVRMNTAAKYYVTIESLLEYLTIHPAFKDTEPKFDAVAKLGCLYSELSAGVHGRTVRDLEMRVSLRKIVFDRNVFEDVHGYLWVSELCKKPLRGKLPKAEFPTALGNPHTPRIPTFRTAPATTA